MFNFYIMRLLIFNLMLIISALLITSCDTSSNNTSASKIDLSSYQTEEIAGNGIRAKKISSDGTLVEEGYVANGVKNGVWITYNPEGRINTMTTYVDGQQSGPHLEFSQRSQIILKAYYNGGVLDGPYATYKNGRYLIESFYKNGKLEGQYKEYFPGGRESGKLQKLMEFKNGKQDGKLEYYDPEGNVTLSYQYKDGEKIEGGLPE